MKADEGAVSGDLQVRLDEIGSLVNRESVCLERVFGGISRCPSMRD